MARYVFLSTPGYGHVNSTIAVVQELVARGETVIYYLPERFPAAIEATGATFRVYQSRFAEAGSFPSGKAISAMLRGEPPVDSGSRPFPFISEGRNVIPQVLDRIRADRPDYIVHGGMNPWAAIIARKLQVSGDSLLPDLAMNEHTRGLFDFGHRFREMLADRREELRRLCEEYDVPAMDLGEFFRQAAPLNLVFLPRAFQPHAETFDERFVFVGPSILPRSDATGFPLDLLDERPVVYMSLARSSMIVRTSSIAASRHSRLVPGRSCSRTASGPIRRRSMRSRRTS